MHLEKEYVYHVVFAKPTKIEIKEKRKDGWELCDAPEGIIGRDLEKEPTHLHSKLYFRKEKKNTEE